MSGRYDAKTTNGIKYFSSLYKSNYEYEQVVDDLDNLKTARDTIVSGGGNVTSYSLGTRSVSRGSMSASETLSLWDKLMRRKLQIERGRKPRRAVGVVPRDW